MADRTILSPANANSLNGLFNGSTPINVSSVNIGTSPSNVVLSANAPGSLVVGGTITTTGGITATNGICVLGNGANSVQLTGTTGTLTVGGGVTANGAQINGVCDANSFNISNGSNAVPLQCLSNSVLTVGGSCVATGSFTAPYYGGGMYVGLYSSPVSIPANSPYTVTIGSIPYNPISGWLASSIYPQFTLTSQYGGIGIQDIGLTKNVDATLTIDLTVYNTNPTSGQELTSFYYFLFYA